MTKQSYLTKIRRYRLKKKAVELLGGKCQKCGWTGNMAAFHFHHRNPDEKEFGVSNSVTTNWEKYYKEVQKCDLLCSNCHEIFHSDYENPAFLKDVENYDGRLLEYSDVRWKNKKQTKTLYNHICKNEKCKNNFQTRYKHSKYCSTECHFISSRIYDRPDKQILIDLLKTKTFTDVAKIYNVSDNCIRKWIK